MNAKLLIALLLSSSGCSFAQSSQREHLSLNDDWRFKRFEQNPDRLVYDILPELEKDKKAEAGDVGPKLTVLKDWIRPGGNDFIKNPGKRHVRPAGNPGSDVPFVRQDFDDAAWQQIDLPHDWAIVLPFYKDRETMMVDGSMGRLPIFGVGWYRKQMAVPEADKGKTINLDIDGAMSYSAVWLNGHLVGGWPYGYNSYRLDLTPHVKFGENNQLAIRVDNPNHSSRFYAGGGIYRNVWLTKTAQVHVGYNGTVVSTPKVDANKAEIEIAVTILNNSRQTLTAELQTAIYLADENGSPQGEAVASFPAQAVPLKPSGSQVNKISTELENPKLWEVLPQRKQNLYVARTSVGVDGTVVDQYETVFGIRTIEFNPKKGLFVNGRKLMIQGVNQHSDLGALGMAFNVRAAERQLEILREMGCKAIRMAHNPPAPELLDLTDRMGFLVVNEIFDCWERRKKPYDFSLIFKDWHEADLRNFIRRDRNHPSIIAWSYGNEHRDNAAASGRIGPALHAIVREEDPTRLAGFSKHYPNLDDVATKDAGYLALNYIGEGLRDEPAYADFKGNKSKPMYPEHHAAFPDKMIFTSESSAMVSTRGTFMFPVTRKNNAGPGEPQGIDEKTKTISAYELQPTFSKSADFCFAMQDKHPFVAGEFVWSGFDYIGEPMPCGGAARSSYFGIIDLAGFPKERFYLYQARWRPELPMAHILPHWNWPDRAGQVTPVHVFTSGDEAELFLNGKSLGKKKKGQYEYRLRWDDVVYQPGVLKVVAYKNGKAWATDEMKTTGAPAKIDLKADRTTIKGDGKDLSFITIKLVDDKGNFVPTTGNLMTVDVSGAGQLVAMDNGNPTDLTSFSSKERNLFSGLLLAIVKANGKGDIKIKVSSKGFQAREITVKTN